MEFFLRPENANIWAEVQNLAEKKDDAGIHAYVVEAQRLTSTQRNMRIATAPAELDGQPVQPGNAIVMLLVSINTLQSIPERQMKDLNHVSRAKLLVTRKRLSTPTSLTRSARLKMCRPSATASTSAWLRIWRELSLLVLSSLWLVSSSFVPRQVKWVW